MKRALWFVAGAGAGVYGMVRGRQAADAFTAEGLHDRMSALFLGARLFREEVAQGAAERETELRERLGRAAPGAPELGSRTADGAPPPPGAATTDQTTEESTR